MTLPEPVQRIAGGQPAEPVWQNQAGGVTFHLPAAGRYVKWSPTGAIDLAVEAERLRWCAAVANLPASVSAVPRLLSSGSDADGSWLATAAIAGRSAVDPCWVARPMAAAAAAIGSGLRRWHDGMPVDRWADLAVATWSVDWNYGPGFDGVLLDAYGIAPDQERTRYYRLLWDLGP